MEFLYLLEKIRVPVLNEFLLAITALGEETALFNDSWPCGYGCQSADEDCLQSSQTVGAGQ